MILHLFGKIVWWCLSERLCLSRALVVIWWYRRNLCDLCFACFFGMLHVLLDAMVSRSWCRCVVLSAALGCFSLILRFKGPIYPSPDSTDCRASFQQNENLKWSLPGCHVLPTFFVVNTAVRTVLWTTRADAHTCPAFVQRRAGGLGIFQRNSPKRHKFHIWGYPVLLWARYWGTYMQT